MPVSPAAGSWRCKNVVDFDSHIRNVMYPLPGVFRQTAPQQTPDVFRNVPRQKLPLRLPAEYGAKRFCNGTPRKWTSAGQHFVKHAAESPNIGPFIKLVCLSRGLFRTHSTRACLERLRVLFR